MEFKLDSIFPIELWKIITESADFLSRINVTLVNKFLHENLPITDLYTIESKYLEKLTNDILKNYPHVIKLNLRFNHCVTDINHLNKLEILDATGGFFDADLEYYRGDADDMHFNNSCGVCILNDKGIEKLTNLKELDVSSNQYITTLNHCKKLKVLTARSYSRLTNDGISKLYNLEDLDLTDNKIINKIDHLKKLRILNISGHRTKISDNDIKTLNLHALDVTNNTEIKDINHMNKLKILMANGPLCGLCTEGINKLKLKIIFADENNKIRQSRLTHMTSIIKFIQELEYPIYEFYYF